MPAYANPTSVLDLAGASHVLLTTYTADGRAEPTPVRAARDDDALVALVGEGTPTAQQVRDEPRVSLAACDGRGHPRGAPVDGVAVVVGSEHVPRVTAALRTAHGRRVRLTELVGALRRSSTPHVGIVVRDV